MTAVLEYSDLVADHFENPRNAGTLSGNDVVSGTGGRHEDGNTIAFDLRIVDGVVRAVAFRAYGCPHAIALASWLTGELEGRRVSEVAKLDLDGVQAVLDLPHDKLGLVLIAEDALRAASENWHASPRSDTVRER